MLLLSNPDVLGALPGGRGGEGRAGSPGPARSCGGCYGPVVLLHAHESICHLCCLCGEELLPATSTHIIASDPPCPLFLDAVGEITLIPGGLGVARDLAGLLLASPSWLLGSIQGINNAGGSKTSSRALAQEAVGDSDGAQACCLACVP